MVGKQSGTCYFLTVSYFEDPFPEDEEDEERGSLTESARRLALRAREYVPGQGTSAGTPETTPNPIPD